MFHEEEKPIFSSGNSERFLSPKISFILGIVTSLLVLGTIGFFILLGFLFR